MQVAGTAAGFVTVPFLVRHIGAGQYGVLVVIVSLAPWLTLVDAAIHPSIRLLVGESRPGGVPLAPVALLRRAFRVSLQVAAMNLAVLVVGLLVVPLVALFGAGGILGAVDVSLGVLAFALPVILSSPGAIYVGAMEGVGRTVAASVITGLGPLALLPLTLAAIAGGADFWVLCLVQGAAVSLPRVVAWLYWLQRPSINPAIDTPHGQLRIGLMLNMLLLSSSYLIQTGLDPVIVSSNLGAESAAAYGIANRIALGAIIPIMVLTPLFTANLAVARRQGWTAASGRELSRLQVQSGMAGFLVAAAVLGLGPWVARLLGAGEVDAPLDLYLAAAAYVFGAYLSTPLLVAFSGPSGLRRSAQLSVVLAVSNLALSVWWVTPFGAAGPLWASAVVGFGATAYWVSMRRFHPDWLEELHS